MELRNVSIEVRPDPDTMDDTSIGDHLTEDLALRVDEVGDSVVAISERFASRLDTPALNDPPLGWRVDEVEIGFSIDLEADAGLVIARVGTKAGFHVNIKWSRGA